MIDVDTSEYKKDNTAELREAILEKNQDLAIQVNDHSLILDVVFINETAKYAILKVSPEIRQTIISNGRKIHTDMRSHYIKDQIHLTQCFACQEHGHKKDSPHCRLNGMSTVVCLYCSDNHASKNCPDSIKKDTTKHKCSNCLRSSNSTIRSNASGHTTTSQNCPSVIRETKAMITRTAGLETKNFFPQRVA